MFTPGLLKRFLTPPDVTTPPGSLNDVTSEALWSFGNTSGGSGWVYDGYSGAYPKSGWGLSNPGTNNGASFTLIAIGGWNNSVRPSGMWVRRKFINSGVIYDKRVKAILEDGTVFDSQSAGLNPGGEESLYLDMPGTGSYLDRVEISGISDSGTNTYLNCNYIAWVD